MNGTWRTTGLGGSGPLAVVGSILPAGVVAAGVVAAYIVAGPWIFIWPLIGAVTLALLRVAHLHAKARALAAANAPVPVRIEMSTEYRGQSMQMCVGCKDVRATRTLTIRGYRVAVCARCQDVAVESIRWGNVSDIPAAITQRRGA